MPCAPKRVVRFCIVKGCGRELRGPDKRSSFTPSDHCDFFPNDQADDRDGPAGSPWPLA